MSRGRQIGFGAYPMINILDRSCAWLVAVGVLFGPLILAAPGFAEESSADLQERLGRLEQALEAQAKKIADQERALEGQARVIADQQDALKRFRGEFDEQRVTLQLHLEPESAWEARAQAVDYYGEQRYYNYGRLQYYSGYPARPAVYTRAVPSAGQVPHAHTQRAQTEEVPAPTRPTEPKRPPEIPVLVERGGVLLRQGRIVIEPSIEYVHSDVNRVEIAGFTVLPAILIGSLELSEADRDTLTGAVTVRYGVTDRFEIEAKVPYVYRDDTTTSRPLAEGAAEDVIASVMGQDIGDIEFAGHYQINEGTGGWPFFVANLRVKTTTGTDPFEVDRDPDTEVETELPTGTGFWGIEPSVTVIYPSDPAVLFGNVSYLYNVERDVGGGFGEIDPGDIVGFNFGLGLGLNERLSMSLSYDHSIVFETEQNGETVPGGTLHVGRAIFNTSYRVYDWMGVNLSVAAGVTDDAPDVQMLLRVPISFDLFD